MMRRFTLAVLFVLACGVRQAAAQNISVPTMNLGTYTGALLTPGSTPITSNCGLLETYDIGLNAGTGSGATTTTRKMTGPGGATLSYQMFQNSTHTTNWGDNYGTDTVDGTCTGSNQTSYIYPQVPAGQNVPPGTYTDTITVTMPYYLLFLQLGTAQTTMTVTAVVQPNCQLSAATLSFGTYSGALIDATSIISVTCTLTTTYNVGLNAGTASGATVTNRSMTGPSSALLRYQLFSNSGHTVNWGNTVGTDTVSGTGTGLAQSLTVYGQIPAGEYATPGSYSDTITATVTY
jgi:spore coat protein U-like protein